MRFCNAPRCPELVEGRRVTHCPGHTATQHAWGPQLAPKLRVDTLNRDGWTCLQCGAPAGDVLLRDPLGSTKLDNLGSLCKACRLKVMRSRPRQRPSR